MVRTLRKLMLAGLGTLDVSEEKLRAVFDDLVERGEVTESDARDLVATWTKRVVDRQAAQAAQIRELVREEVKLGYATRQEFEALSELVALLARRVASDEDVSVRR